MTVVFRKKKYIWLGCKFSQPYSYALLSANCLTVKPIFINFRITTVASVALRRFMGPFSISNHGSPF